MKRFLLIIFGLVLFIFPISAIVTRGTSAISGITWGYKSILCNSGLKPLQKNCNLEWKNITINFGVYDPEDHFDKVNTMAIQHQFIKWNEYRKGNLDEFFENVFQKNRWPMVTVEPFSKDGSQEKNTSLLTDIVDGLYDGEIDTICADFKNSKNPVFVRWGHEMENVTERYPWAKEDHDSFIYAFRYFVDKCRSIDSKNFYIWSPVGHKNANNYWPGNEYVDLIGLSVFIYPKWDIDNYGKVRDFDEIFSEKYNIFKVYNKPIIITEFGVTGDDQFQKEWFLDAVNSSYNYPLLKTISYFNAVDSPEAWGTNYPTPDWKINPELFQYTN
ncbi:hypothetical protein A3D84_02580 [Candidatus Woesebacteria bacterium RIFCSPHIGHO2_02_FULL_42_20]|uniref:GH26 domain-containing protein n=1 Tax=Candidatus Woesebacteria bacterium RIFCSPHIGHO2_12_FULL_41_24 TaxID=1802510 RepID=A0A1F8APJ4_9BACT|nr:MAG: hypothetical protein A2W15_02775 [Candidatus Woesebacteria bacterium RBG_16_41_13]OGM29231.1 MAG: hypothetical protein A2873_03125 [Candidatus Woesebacteria bacterium RIFCSPHIGHO2_01_FULL_42_80]OGM34729.1 MAG: hypothetical protein A3D84_02580 [Candidatus Woesebacteria bacterium RIFCSPHIGHO2_02_FULL_42_20]OGM53682.1 MAG: hypothetical protein A3E44_02260 [Candidatus Woesebacteria bacterium RIFCSPHIGHO2_12_FULL_41_24]OGM67028.1 MAG: hypothetical protein A2969_05775 [Candidatus Woesebacteri